MVLGYFKVIIMKIVEKLLRKLLSIECVECGEVRVLFWTRRCSFCGVGEGKMR